MKGRNLQEIAQLLGTSTSQNFSISGVAIDSRELKEGQLFFALKGAKVDGHLFLSEAAKKGAIAAVVSKEYRGESFGMPLLFVDDVKQSLQSLATYAISERKVPIVGITGSVGKTTTKEFTAKLLEKKYKVGKSFGSANSQLGLPLAILNLEGGEELLVLEMGMTEPNEIAKLVQLAPPDIAAVTRIGMGHVGFFEKGIEGIAEAKAEILSHSKTELAILNAQCLSFKAFKNLRGKEQVLFTTSRELDEQFGEVDYYLENGGEGNYAIRERGAWTCSFQLPFAASHLIEDFLVAAAIARTLKMQWEEIFSQAMHLTPYKLRFETIVREGVTYIQDCYNANPDSMVAAMSNLPKTKPGAQRIAAIGYMVEMGPESAVLHRKMGEYALNHFDHLLCIGELCRPMMDPFVEAKKPAEFFPNLNALRKRLFELAKPDDLVLIKGSKPNQLWKVLEEV